MLPIFSINLNLKINYINGKKFWIIYFFIFNFTSFLNKV